MLIAQCSHLPELRVSIISPTIKSIHASQYLITSVVFWYGFGAMSCTFCD